jgi:hypothetical protein
VEVTFRPAFPSGLTSIANAGSSGRLFRQVSIPTVEGAFNVDDSVAPVLDSARVMEPDSLHPLKRVILDVSEPVVFPPDPSPAFVYKRGDKAFPIGQVRIARTEAIGDKRWILYLDSLSEALPVAGDSIALAGLSGSGGGPGNPAAQGLDRAALVRDRFGNAPMRPLFRRLDGDPPRPRPMDLFVSFPNGSRETPSSGLTAEAPANAIFVPVDRDGRPLPGRCEGCITYADGAFLGPVFHISTSGPVAWRFTIFSTLGEPVAQGSGSLEAADLDWMEKKEGASGARYAARIVWTGRTAKGNKAATGAYILQATLTGGPDPKTGAPGGVKTLRTVFGHLRATP